MSAALLYRAPGAFCIFVSRVMAEGHVDGRRVRTTLHFHSECQPANTHRQPWSTESDRLGTRGL